MNRQIDDERHRIVAMESRYRESLEALRQDHKGTLKTIEEKQETKLSLYSREKQRLIEDMNKTIELEKEKISNLQKLDISNLKAKH